MLKLGLTTSQAAVLSSGSDEFPKLLIYVFDKMVRTEAIEISDWQGVPVEFVKQKRMKLHG